MKQGIKIAITTVLAVLLSTSIGAIQSKAEEPAKDNVYITSKKATVSEVTKQAEASKLAEIAAKKAKQEEIDRIAIDRKDTLKRAKIESDKVESISLPMLGNNQTAIGVKLYAYLRYASNISSVLNRAVILHNGDPCNTCVYFSSEVMRRLGIAVPSSTANTGQYLYYLRTHAFIASYNIKELTAGSICFTKPGLHGYYPTHTFVFMGWVTSGNYTWAYVADNQGNAVHVRNMGVTTATDAFDFFMHTPTPPTQINATSSGYNSINIRWSTVTGANGYEIYKATSSKAAYKLLSTTTSSSYNNAYITTNNAYYYKVRAYRLIGNCKAYSGFSTITSAKPVLASPIAVKAVSSSYNSINVSWNGVSGASGYEVYKATSSKAVFILLPTTSAKNYNNTYITPNNTYYYKVRAYRLIGKAKVYSGFSTIISAKPILFSPNSVKAVSSYNSIYTSWSTVNGASAYEVYRATSSIGSYALVSSTNAKSYYNAGLKINSNYYYKVRAYRLIGKVKVYSGFSSVIDAKTILGTPTLVKVVSSSYNGINVSWSGVTGASRYEIYRSTSKTGSYNLLSSTTAKSYNNTGLTTNKIYYYKVRAYGVVGSLKVYSNWTNVIYSKPVPSNPTNVKATKTSSKSIKATWSNVSGANGYEVFKATSSNGTYNLLWRTESSCCTNSRLTAGKTYYYKIRSYTIVGKTRVYGDKWSAVVHAKA